ncbi:MAG: ROK family protein [Clostridia bacterium]
MRIRKGSRKLIKDLNISLVIDAVRQHGPISRADLARVTNLGRSTITGIASVLLEEGFLVELGSGESRVGRRPILLKFNEKARPVIAIKLAPGRIVGAVTDMDAHLLCQQERLLADSETADEIVEALIQMTHALLTEAKVDIDDVLGMGMVLPGIVDPKTGVSVWPSFFNWINVPMKQILEDRLGVQVFIDNDANAAALAEKWYGAGRDYADLVCVTVGAGVGAGLIVGGRLYRGGASGAGEIGHMTIDEEGPQCICGNRGCLEAMVSDKALVRQAVERLAENPGSMVLQLAEGDKSKITREIIVEAAKAGDEMAQALIRQAGTHIGTGLANLVNILNPEAIIVGGEAAAQAGDLLLEPIRRTVKERAFAVLSEKTEILPAKLPDGWLVGAAILVLQEFFGLPIYRQEDGRKSINLASLV